MCSARPTVGIDIVSDGEFGKTISWSRYILDRISGFEEREIPGASFRTSVAGKDRQDFKEFYDEYERQYGFVGMGSTQKTGSWFITGPITYTGHAAIGRDIAGLKRAIAGKNVVNAFLPVVAPASVVPARTDEFYKSEEEALFAIAATMREEYKAITDAGLIAQIDDAFLASVYDVMVPPKSLADYRKWAELRIEALNHALAGIPEHLTRYHLCWGSWNGPHTNDVPMKDIVDLMLRDQRRRLRDRDGQPAPRARVDGVGERQAAGGAHPRARRDQPRHQHRRASRARRPAHRAARQPGRP